MVKKLYSDLPKSQQQDLKQNNTELQFSHTKEYNNENLENCKNIFWIKRKVKKTRICVTLVSIYLLKGNDRNTITTYEICSKLTIKTPIASFWCVYC